MSNGQCVSDLIVHLNCIINLNHFIQMISLLKSICLQDRPLSVSQIPRVKNFSQFLIVDIPALCYVYKYAIPGNS